MSEIKPKMVDGVPRCTTKCPCFKKTPGTLDGPREPSHSGDCIDEHGPVADPSGSYVVYGELVAALRGAE